jgi:hypothetical protein
MLRLSAAVLQAAHRESRQAIRCPSSPVEIEGEQITMPRNVNDIIDKLSPAQRRKVEKRAAALLAEELSLRELRRAHKLTQVKLAKSLGVRQEQISRLEQRSDLLISTLRGYVEAMGGRLSLVAEFPNRKPVTLSGIAEMD